ncbi:hypothetical protein AG1IA_07061 [Rhizoctonia solani AG-1 IA]|uniref:Uncharacterized protein n=1 Tax=Thanatephorus cucumeris (strain AG1-IA) TaxID=983506 RepID=L8WQ57_THACA|nr:hypothetical protein AG1IA_07061 [Rhizoctonia solani AG-1 IA]
MGLFVKTAHEDFRGIDYILPSPERQGYDRILALEPREARWCDTDAGTEASFETRVLRKEKWIRTARGKGVVDEFPIFVPGTESGERKKPGPYSMTGSPHGRQPANNITSRDYDETPEPAKPGTGPPPLIAQPCQAEPFRWQSWGNKKQVWDIPRRNSWRRSQQLH